MIEIAEEQNYFQIDRHKNMMKASFRLLNTKKMTIKIM